MYHLVDISSLNGTCVNGMPLRRGEGHVLAEGDRIRLATFVIDPTKSLEQALSRPAKRG